jgi:diguanylate cyclase (GGDEF)-like protein/PAS domain S-box-containing protein
VGRPYGPMDWVEREDLGEPGFATEQRGALTNPAKGQTDAETALLAAEERYRYTISLSPLIPWIADADGNLVDLDERGLECTGFTRDDCMGLGFLSAVHAADRPLVRAAWRQAKCTGQFVDYEVRLCRPDGEYRWHRVRAAPRRAPDGIVLCWYGTIEDVHDRKLDHEAVRWAADHDGLTGLWNRSAFMRGLYTALDGARGSGVEVALVLIDLDQFKALNDRHGHGAGDALLQEVARRLDSSGTGDGMPGRLGGDEFALFIFTPDRDHLEERIADLRRTLEVPYWLDGESHICRASIGIAIYPGHGDDADTLYKNADLALYEAKNAGKDISHFQSGMRAGLQIRMSQLSVARHALDHDRILPFYQPKVDLCSGRITGFEALLRWQHDTRGVQAPATIAAAFEEAELAIALDARIFDRLASDISRWVRADVPFGRIAFNISPAEFRRDGFAKRMLSRIERAGIPVSSLELEVTETVFLGKSPDKVVEIFATLRAAGLTIALDDFGMGFASLVHLKQFPVDVIKIDCSFVHTLDDPANAAIVRAIIGLGNDLGIATVAEGVETREQADYLHRKGCRLGQGYLFSPAVPADQIPALLVGTKAQWRPADRRSGWERRVK